MPPLEKIVKQFCWGISVLTAYLNYNNKINYSDINILSEGFVRDLLNILFDLNLSNPSQPNTPGYDLISKDNKIIIQVSTTCTPQKVKHTFSALKGAISKITQQREMLENELTNAEKALEDINSTIAIQRNNLELAIDKKKRDELSSEILQLAEEREQSKSKLGEIRKALAGIEDIRGYNVRFFFLCENADTVINYKSKCGFSDEVPEELQFCQSSDVLSFISLIRKVSCLSQLADENRINRLQEFMDQNANIFEIREFSAPQENKVSKIIDEYADNFISPLFRHQYSDDSRVTLKNLFVEPSFSRINPAYGSDDICDNIIALLDSFIWDSKKDRLLFIDGDAAIGKTSLISWLCYHYREMDDIGKSIFFNLKLVCVRLRDISFTKNTSAEDCILNYLSFKNMKAFQQRYSNALIVLEGADELGIINRMESSSIEQFVKDTRKAFKSCKIVITSRPKFIDMAEFSGSSKPCSYQHYVLNHFSKEKRSDWLSNYESKDKCGQVIAQNTRRYLLGLTDDEAAGVADTPLALYLLAICDITEPLRNNKWVLYHQIFYKAIRDTPYNEAFHGKGSMHRALQEESFAQTVYIIIGEIAHQMFVNFKKDRFFISSNELESIINIYSSNSFEERNAVRKCCVLCAYWKENSDIGALEFYHNDIRAFFMSEYIYLKFSRVNLSSASKESIEQFIKLACETFQYGIISRSTWAQTFYFLYWRLQYEKDNRRLPECFPDEQGVEHIFRSILSETIDNNVMWKHSFHGPSYESIKTTFFNFVLFLRIWLSPVSPTPLTSFSNSELFKDWIKLFSDNIEISKNKHIALGSQMKYQNMAFDNANLAEACFEESIFVQSSFKSANLKMGIFCNSHLENVDFSNADLRNANFDGATIINVNFSSANLSHTSFQNTKIINSIFPKSATKIENAVFSNASITSVDWKNLDFKHIQLTSTVFAECTFRKATFPQSLDQVNFINCSMFNCSFRSCSGVRFEGGSSSIVLPHFSGMISNCSFENIALGNSDWNSATLDNISFINSKIESLSFRGTKIGKLTFLGCSVDGNIDILQASLSQATLNLLKEQTRRIINVSSSKIITENL